MRLNYAGALLLSSLGQSLALPTSSSTSESSLIVENAPDHVRPYVIRHHSHARAVTVETQLYRFYVTGPSSGYAFTLMGTNAPHSDALGVLPHIHQRHYENFFCSKGSFQLWAQGDDDTQQTRVLSAGDYGSVPRNVTHTFQIQDPDTEMVGVIVPGGFEELFYHLGSNISDTTHSPYVPRSGSSSSAAGPDSTFITTLESYDVYAKLSFSPRYDAVNGTAPSGSVWHNGANELGKVGKPYFLANGWSPKYLNSQYGYQIVAPFVTPTQSQDTNYTLSTISLSTTPSSVKVPTWTFPGACAFQVQEGRVVIQIGDYPVTELVSGDVAFIPGGVAFSYYSEAYFSKVLFVSSGTEGLDQKLIAEGKAWDYVTFPTTW
ncbi:quercetin 2,3-dioxygenase anaerobically complexed with the substrate kaempferol [Aspergillus homomorphus CBS 101889]|uniref:Quercetin 2,3-dioxygenase anaerobically complexed with the substrate kaempferol n=1 Tax=Aspergillus homomorphus (strain CBS 101889) TaxID=1450537 RepID=A0A395IBN7_ASPHC|nr:quercetin 2,3-dioxygenase anaerobically complexed with the substrate kaempferol [Aspergillus homomorphus CBS 101889]RAL17456.1 quercetin 2,3-dioxygenase anaerobically complexed with the substrate kaempferol [Aspergillus homomorphus CBS 101889]